MRAGRPDAARDGLPQIVARARASGTDWAIGMELQCRALLAGDDDADDDENDAGRLHAEAVERLARTGAERCWPAPSCSTASGCAGAVAGSRRAQLRPAHQALSAMGANGFAARAEQELLATGGHPRKRSVDLRDTLTAQELLIARRVAAGATSKEVAAELFLSPRTIDAHLRNTFPKLAITSQRQLRGLPL